jgi:hypothetical protein
VPALAVQEVETACPKQRRGGHVLGSVEPGVRGPSPGRRGEGQVRDRGGESPRATLRTQAGLPPSDKHAPEVMRLIEEEGHLQRRVAERIDIWKTTVNGIVKRHGEKKDSPAVPRA